MIYLAIRLLQFFGERWLDYANRTYYNDPARQKHAQEALEISATDMQKSVAYASDKSRFGTWSSWFGQIVGIAFLCLGGLPIVLGWAQSLSSSVGGGAIVDGLFFLGILGLLSSIVGMPWEYYNTFVIEEKHGFNKQTPKGFFIDRIKGFSIGIVLGGGLLSVLLYVMESVNNWWIWAWLLFFGFNLVIAWLYPTVLAPIFNKFSPLEAGELKDSLFALAKKVKFNADSISVMNASIRSSHGNAYFSGMFGKKKIVLFDTLIEAMSPKEIVAVLAHELGHFKLHHIRWSLIRSFFITGLMFYVLSLCLPQKAFYEAFFLEEVSSYGALVVFSLWFGPIGFLFQPIGTYLSRRNEFAADAFALENIEDRRTLGDALLKLRRKSHGMPLTHPKYSMVYHSHPPMLERLKAMNWQPKPEP